MPNKVVKTTTPKDQRDIWRTPPDIFARANSRYGPFDLDSAATHENKLCRLWLGPDSFLGVDALTASWHIGVEAAPTRVWCNPPYSKNRQFVWKAADEARFGRAQTTLLVPATTDVAWWHEFVWDGTGPRPGVIVELLSGRIRFLRPDGSQAGMPNFGSCLITFLARFGASASLTIPKGRAKAGN